MSALAGCVNRPPYTPTEPPTDSQSGDLNPDGTPTVVAQIPGQCELLLKTLRETRPLLEDLDGQLDEHAGRVETALAEFEQPAAEPPLPECPEPSADVLGGKELIGAIEWLWMDPPGLHYEARIDTGVETSSLSAADVVEFERDGDDWVRFIHVADGSDEPVEIELPIVRTVLIRQPSVEELDRRVVVEMSIRLGQQVRRTEFTLTDRSSMSFPVILGRAFLMDIYVVDVAETHLHPRYEAP